MTRDSDYITELKERFASDSIEISVIYDTIPIVKVTNRYASAVVSIYGAHVLSYARRNSRNVLWLSSESNFAEGKAIRGGIPVCWPWFSSAGTPTHGVARISMWDLVCAEEKEDGSTKLEFHLDKSAEFGLKAVLVIEIGASLEVALTTENVGSDVYELTSALHSYFTVSEIGKVKVSGLDGVRYMDLLAGKEIIQKGDILFSSETDRIYYSASSAVIHDSEWERSILVEKTGSESTVVWNPWTEKSKKMPDFGDSEYHYMLCIESANAGPDKRRLAPGKKHTLSTKITEQ